MLSCEDFLEQDGSLLFEDELGGKSGVDQSFELLSPA
jgi:hypothetical protein